MFYFKLPDLVSPGVLLLRNIQSSAMEHSTHHLPFTTSQAKPDPQVPLLAGKWSSLEISSPLRQGVKICIIPEHYTSASSNLSRLNPLRLVLVCWSGVGPGLSVHRPDRLSIPLPLTDSFPWIPPKFISLEHYVSQCPLPLESLTSLECSVHPKLSSSKSWRSAFLSQNVLSPYLQG